LTHDQRGSSVVMVVNAEDKVEARLVQTRGVQGDKWIVTGGLANGEKVIVEGLQKARPGQPVQVQVIGGPQEAAPAQTAPTAAPAAN